MSRAAAGCASKSRALSQLEAGSAVTIVAEGKAVYKAITVAEIAKRRVRGLHQNTQVGATHAKRSELDEAATVPMIQITLSSQALDENQPGYQHPLTTHDLDRAWIDEAELEAVAMEEGEGDDSASRKRRQRPRDAARKLRKQQGRVAATLLPRT